MSYYAPSSPDLLFSIPPRPQSHPPSTQPRVPSPEVVSPVPSPPRRRLSTITERTEYSTPPSRPSSPRYASDVPIISLPPPHIIPTPRRPLRRSSRSRSSSRSPRRSPSPDARPPPIIVPTPRRPRRRSSRSSSSSRSPRRSRSPGASLPPIITPTPRRSRRRSSRSRSSSRSPRRSPSPDARPPTIVPTPRRPRRRSSRSRSSSRSPRRSPTPRRSRRRRFSRSRSPSRNSRRSPSPDAGPPPIIIPASRRTRRRHRRSRSPSPNNSPRRSPDPSPPLRRVRLATQPELQAPYPVSSIPYYYVPPAVPPPPPPPPIVIGPPSSRRRRRSPTQSSPQRSYSPRRYYPPSQPEIPLPYSPTPYYNPPPVIIAARSPSEDDREDHRSTVRSWRDESDPIPDSPFTSQFYGDQEWRKYIHPNGALYWYSSQSRIVSDQQPHNGSIMLVGPQLESIRGEDNPEEWELYVTGGMYHFVHHSSRSMSAPSEMLYLFKARIAQASTDIITRLDLEYHYWTYVQGHPNHVNLPLEAKYDAEEAILWSHADRCLFDSSNAPFEKEVAKEMFSILRQLDVLSRATLSVWFIAAVMRSVVKERKACHHGTPLARKYRQNEKIEDVTELQEFASIRKTFIWRMIAILTLGAPFSYMKRIINVDRSNGISTSRWRAFLKNLCAEWVDTNLLSTVLVSATTAVLATPGLNPLAQVAAFCSILSSLSAVLCGMLLIFTHRGRMESTGHAAYLYFDYAKRLTGSPHSLAVLLSLPLVLTSWSIFWFVLSIASLAYKPGIPLFPVVWGRVLRYGTLTLVGCLVVIITAVGFFFRSRKQSSAPAMGPVHLPPPAYVPYPPPMFVPPPIYATPYVPTPMTSAVFRGPGQWDSAPITYRPAEVITATRRRRHSSSNRSHAGTATFRPHSV